MTARDEDLGRMLRACRRGNERAARSLHAALAPGLVALARFVLGGDDALAEDCVQQAFCRVFEAPTREIRRVRDPRLWLAGVVRNECRMAARAASRRRAREAAVGELAGGGGGAGEASEAERLRMAVGELDGAHGEVVMLRHAAGLTHGQVAELLGENENTVASRYRAAIGRLRERLAAARAKEAV